MKLKNRLSIMSREEIGNLILLIALLCAFISTIICGVLDDLHIFYLGLARPVKVSLILILFIIIGSAYVMLIKTKSDVLSRGWYKYYLLGAMFVWLALNCSMVFFHSTILLLFPIFISRCYNSTRVIVVGIVLTLILIIITPIIAFYCGGMDVSFLLWFLTKLFPEGVSSQGMDVWKVGSGFQTGLVNIPVPAQLLLWISLPRLIVATSLIILSVAGNLSNRKMYEKQIKHIMKLQDSIIDSMSEVIENRDFMTGGHVRRTQDNVKILVSEIRKDIDMPDKYWDDVIKSAAMHDLGKIAVKDTILNKPGKLTDEEFEIIKKHPVNSKNIIDKIFEKIDDDELLKVAENVAMFHHEKFNGMGYPAGLKGEEIPLEARIMAIADVYDALVSERCYKKPYSSEEAYGIIKDSMGSHFDPSLWEAFDRSCSKLEAYYK